MVPAPHNRPQIKAACRDGVARGASRRRSNLAPLALATRLGEKRREHRLHRPRLAFRAGGAPLAVLADRLLEAEALPAPGAAVLVDRHRCRKAIPARTWRSSRPSQNLRWTRPSGRVHQRCTSVSKPKPRCSYRDPPPARGGDLWRERVGSVPCDLPSRTSSYQLQPESHVTAGRFASL